MTRTDVVASSRPQKAAAATMRKGSPRARKLVVLSVAFALMMALVSPAAVFAAEETSPYNTKPPTTTTTSTPPPTTTATPTPAPTPAPTPTSGTSPEKQSSTPEKSTAPETKKEEPTKETVPTTTAKKATSLPFTGFDLRWTIAAGIVLLATGFSIVTMQRRQRRSNGR
jgi:outer membrane biosynthesis protein TonB